MANRIHRLFRLPNEQVYRPGANSLDVERSSVAQAPLRPLARLLFNNPAVALRGRTYETANFFSVCGDHLPVRRRLVCPGVSRLG